MNNFKIGDFVYFSLSNKGDKKLFTHSGMIINISDNNIVAILDDATHNRIIYSVIIEDIRPLTDKEAISNDINEYYNTKIQELNSQIKSVKKEYCKEEIVNKHCTLKQEIINTAKEDQDLENIKMHYFLC